MLFKSFGFSYNGKHSSQYSLRISKIGANDSTSMFGIQRSLTTENNGAFMSGLSNTTYNNTSFEIQLVKTDGDYVIPFDKDELFEIIEWLFQEDFKPFISDDNRDIVYYAMATGGSKYENALKQGYLSITFQLNAPCGFTAIQTNPMYIQGEHTFELFNKSNLETWNYPDVEFKLITGESIEIENLTTGETMAFSGLKEGVEVYCYNEDLKQLQCTSDTSYNVRPKFNKQWLRLAKGRNVIQIRAKNAQVRIIGQSKVAFM